MDTDGRLHPLIRAGIYSLLAFWLLSADELPGPVLRLLAGALHVNGLSAGAVAFWETVNLSTALLLTWGFARYERRRIGDFGLPLRRGAAARLCEGFAIGIVGGGAVAVGMAALGGMRVHGLAVHGWVVVSSALAWLGANLLVGFGEEMLFRGYLLKTLWKSFGFWPASVIIALGFAADHYFFKQGENIWDVISLVSISLWLCYTVLQTGTLWLAVGFHAAFDYMQLFVIGTRNGGIAPEGRFLDASFPGPAWINGGVLGTEASFLLYPVIVVMFLYMGWRFRSPRTASQPRAIAI